MKEAALYAGVDLQEPEMRQPMSRLIVPLFERYKKLFRKIEIMSISRAIEKYLK